jgi:hypothetical protein
MGDWRCLNWKNWMRGTVMDMIIESGNDFCDDEYRQVATQEDFDSF